MKRVPAVLVTGTSTQAMASVTLGLQWELPRVVVVEHRIDVETQQLHRVVSDVGGVVEREQLSLAGHCVTCTVRDDVVATLERVAQSGRWQAVVAHLPVGTEAASVCRVITGDRGRAPHVRVSGVVAALPAGTAVDDLLGDDLLAERGLHSGADDRRGAAEVLCSMVEYADLVAVSGPLPMRERDLLLALARPGVPVRDVNELEARLFLDGIHRHERTEAWAAEVLRVEPPTGTGGEAWTLQLHADRPFHPERLRENVERIGGGPRRSRGCFWLPSRPGQIIAWAGAGGQLGVGVCGRWGREDPFTRILVTGVDGGRAEVVAAFEDSLLSADEMARRGRFWEVTHDGLEDWLGGIRRAA